MKRIAVGLLILVSALFSMVPPSAYAFTVPNTADAGWQNALTNQLAVTVANTGDLIVVAIQLIDGVNGVHNTISVAGVVDTQLNSYSLASASSYHTGATCLAGICDDAELWSAVATASGSDSVTVTASQSCPNCNMEILDVVGLKGTQSESATGSYNGVNSQAFSTTTSLTWSSTDNDIAIASLMTPCNAANSLSSGTGFNLINPVAPNAGTMEYGAPTAQVNVPNPTNFAAACSANTGWLDAGALFGPRNQVSVTEVVACTWYQLQCWWYPMLFFGVYAGGFMLLGGAGKVSARGLTYLLLSGLTFAGLTMVLMDMLTVMVPLLLTALTTLYAVRTR